VIFFGLCVGGASLYHLQWLVPLDLEISVLVWFAVLRYRPHVDRLHFLNNPGLLKMMDEGVSFGHGISAWLLTTLAVEART
jgi:hypothetical protein